jgi:peroxiredoxin
MEQPTEHPSEFTAPPVGGMAPDFTLPDETGKAHTLSEELEKGKPVALLFMRGEW